MLVEKCRAIGCQTPCPPRHIMCPSHWSMVSKKIKDALWAGYREASEEDRPRHVPYLEACAKAIESVAKQEKRPAENSYRRLLAKMKS